MGSIGALGWGSAYGEADLWPAPGGGSCAVRGDCSRAGKHPPPAELSRSLCQLSWYSRSTFGGWGLGKADSMGG